MQRSAKSQDSGGIGLKKRFSNLVVAPPIPLLATSGQKLQYLQMKRCKTSTTRSRVSAGPTLPEELIYNILNRLPVKALMRFKFACKSWQAIISDPRFIAFHLQRERKENFRVLSIPIYGSGTFSYIMELEEKPVSCKPQILDIPGLEAMAYSHAVPSHCDGLLLFDCEQKMHVINPATREVVTLPMVSPSKKPTFHLLLANQTAVLGHDTRKKKVVRYFYRCFDYDSHSCSLGLEVFTLGSGSCWVPAEDPPYPILPEWQLHVHGVIYWYIDNYLHRSSPQAILCFNLRDNKFALLPAPPVCTDVTCFSTVSSLRELDRNLSCLVDCGSLFHLYVYRNADCKERHGAWHVMYTMSVSTLRPPGGVHGIFHHNGKILICSDSCFQLYDPQTQTMEVVAGSMNKLPAFSNKFKNAVEHRDLCLRWMHLTHYIESMVHIG